MERKLSTEIDYAKLRKMKRKDTRFKNFMNEYFINRFRTLVLVRETIRFPVRSKSYKEQFSRNNLPMYIILYVATVTEIVITKF